MKILSIIGSPRKGNTYKIVRRIEEQLKLNPEVEMEYIYLKDVDLQTCIGCFNCITRGHHLCPLKDEKESIYQKILSSDGLIVATPAYNFNVTSLLKNFIDRFAYIGHQPKFFHNNVFFVVSSAGTGLKEVKKYLINFVGKLWGFRSITYLGLLTPPYKKIDKLIRKDNEEIIKNANVFQKNLSSKKISPKIYQLQQFCMMRAIFSNEAMKKNFPLDYNFYNSMKNEQFYIPIKINSLKYTLINLSCKFIAYFITKTIKKPSDC